MTCPKSQVYDRWRARGAETLGRFTARAGQPKANLALAEFTDIPNS